MALSLGAVPPPWDSVCFNSLSTLLVVSVSGKNLFDAKTVGVGIAVGHGIQDQDDVVAVVIGAACGRFHAEAGCYSRDENLGHAALSQVMQIRADKRPVAAR